MVRKLLVIVTALAAFAVVAAPSFAAKGGTTESCGNLENATRCPERPLPRKPNSGATIKKQKGGLTFFVRARANEKAGSLGMQLADADAEVHANGSFFNPDEEESGDIDQFALRPVKAGSTLYYVRLPNSVFSRYGDDNFYWQAYRTLPERQCRTMNSGKLDCFQQSRVRTFAYRIFG